MEVREYGSSGPSLVLLHGGPGAPGSVAPIAHELSDAFRVLEPFQRGSSDVPLTVARHVGDLHDLIESRCDGERPALVGHSWGAMLALAYAAEHPGRASSLVLIGCGTFDLAARAQMQKMINGRLGEDMFSYDPVPDTVDAPPCDGIAMEQTWSDMVRMQSEGVYPAAFSAIDVPVIMLHGAYDPHPGRMIADGLKPYMPQLEYREWERCGHDPWRERAARDEFYRVLREWLTATDGDIASDIS